MTATLPPNLLQVAPIRRHTLTVALFDDQPASRAGFSQLLAGEDVAVMIAEPLDAEAAEYRLGDVGSVDVLVVATGGPNGPGLSLARQIARAGNGTPLLLLADTSTELDLPTVLAHGAAGYVCRRCSIDRVVRALRALATGGMSVECPGDSADFLPSGNLLSERERLIVSEFARGGSTEQVAERHWVSPHTVRTHMKNIQRKLDARTRTHAIAIAIALGEVSVDPPPTG